MLDLFALKDQKFEDNFLVIKKMLGTTAETLLKVTSQDIQIGKVASEQGCAIAQACFRYFGSNCTPRVFEKQNGTTEHWIEISDLRERPIVRYLLSPKAYSGKEGFVFQPHLFDET